MIGLQCKACGHRALITREGPTFMMDHEIISKLRQSAPPTCSQCGVSDVIHVQMSSDMSDRWLKAEKID